MNGGRLVTPGRLNSGLLLAGFVTCAIAAGCHNPAAVGPWAGQGLACLDANCPADSVATSADSHLDSQQPTLHDTKAGADGGIDTHNDGSDLPKFATGEPGTCWIGSSADCAQSDGCKEYGLCTLAKAPWFAENTCVIASDADCKQSEHCRLEAKCTYVAPSQSYGNGLCSRQSQADCLFHEGCGKGGACHFDGSKCVPGSTPNCLLTQACSDNGQCLFKGSECVPGSKADCAKNKYCISDGRCDFDGKSCKVGEPQHCKQSTSKTKGNESVQGQSRACRARVHRTPGQSLD